MAPWWSQVSSWLGGSWPGCLLFPCTGAPAVRCVACVMLLCLDRNTGRLPCCWLWHVPAAPHSHPLSLPPSPHLLPCPQSMPATIPSASTPAVRQWWSRWKWGIASAAPAAMLPMLLLLPPPPGHPSRSVMPLRPPLTRIVLQACTTTLTATPLLLSWTTLSLSAAMAPPMTVGGGDCVAGGGG